jgi:hypothetical protein
MTVRLAGLVEASRGDSERFFYLLRPCLRSLTPDSEVFVLVRSVLRVYCHKR